MTIQAVPTGRLMFFFMQVNSGPLADGRVRRALNLILPRQEIVDITLNGLGGSPGAGILLPTAPWANAALVPAPYDPEAALALLAEAGIADSDGDGRLDRGGAPFRLVVRSYQGRPSMQPAAELYLACLHEHGIDSELQVLRDWTVAVDDFREGRADMPMFCSNSAPTGNPAYFLNFTFRTGALENFGSWSNAEFDAPLAEGIRTFDGEERTRILDRMQEIIDEALPLIVAFCKNRLAVWHNDVAGFSLHPAGIYLVNNQSHDMLETIRRAGGLDQPLLVQHDRFRPFRPDFMEPFVNATSVFCPPCQHCGPACRHPHRRLRPGQHPRVGQ